MEEGEGDERTKLSLRKEGEVEEVEEVDEGAEPSSRKKEAEEGTELLRKQGG